jgi:hypothetical protein
MRESKRARALEQQEAQQQHVYDRVSGARAAFGLRGSAAAQQLQRRY